MLGEFLKRSVTVGEHTYHYQVYVASGMPKNPPAILFMHGAGESGDDNDSQTKVGIGHAVRENPDRWPFLIIFPQKPTMDLWPHYVPMLQAILKQVEQEFSPAPDKRFLTGLSQGGNGTLTLNHVLDWKFSAAVALCGWADPKDASERLHDTPIWLIHGEADPVVPVSSSIAVADHLKKTGAVYKLTTYPGVEHNCWDKGYAEDVPGWFLNHAGGATHS